ncbi:MAG: hypothetical protein A2Y25_02405 [Candidatus Melainabacteria bacterium GWF2_37_15]|nr:MAG: hypothetical protein A2Y25_02405 [Candidatus Melainabacteria bacterium GWF2_37_15]
MDKITKEQRSLTMKAVKSSKTSLENKVTSALFQKGVRFRKNERSLKGTPDISIKKYRIVIFILDTGNHILLFIKSSNKGH